MENKKTNNLIKVNGLYKLRLDNMCVYMEYSKNNKNFHECMLNILKQNLKGWHIYKRMLKYKKKGRKDKWQEENQSILLLKIIL